MEVDDDHMKIARNANDILSKHLTNACPRGVLDVIGITDATIVLYTENINEGPTSLDIGTAIYQVENVYLNRLNGDEALAVMEHHLANATWTPQDRVRPAFAFHMHFGSTHKKKRSKRY